MSETDPTPPQPKPVPKKPGGKEERLARALRENLQRRKAAAPKDEG